MKIRTAFVTNSSSTTFLLITIEEFSPEYIFKKLGFKKNSPMEDLAMELCNSLYRGPCLGLYHGQQDEEINENSIRKNFGEYCTEKYKYYNKKGYHTYWGQTATDDGEILTAFFTADTFEIEESGIYLNGRKCTF